MAKKYSPDPETKIYVFVKVKLFHPIEFRVLCVDKNLKNKKKEEKKGNNEKNKVNKTCWRVTLNFIFVFITSL